MKNDQDADNKQITTTDIPLENVATPVPDSLQSAPTTDEQPAMNDTKKQSLNDETVTKKANILYNSRKEVAKNKKNTFSKLAVVALIIIVIFGIVVAYGYSLVQQSLINNQADINELQVTQAQAISRLQAQNKKQFTQQQSANQQETLALLAQVEQQKETLAMLVQQQRQLSGRRPNDWLLAEANYLVGLAGRKLWQEKNHATAIELLMTADLRIAEMNEVSLITIRQSLASDIATLKALPKERSEDLTLQIDGLISQIEHLKLNMVELPEAVEDADSENVSSSTSDWRANLTKTWLNFSEGFITVRRRSSSVEPLMSPKQQWYLEENLKAKLLQAQLSIYRQQQAPFDNAIAQATRWVKQFFDQQDSTTKYILDELNTLKDRTINISYPQNLQSTHIIAQKMRQRSIGFNDDTEL